MSRKIYTRTSPYAAKIRERFLLTGPGSTKETFHVALEASFAELPYKVGDSVGVIPTNDPALVEEILQRLNKDPEEVVLDPRSKTESSLREYLLQKANLARVSSKLHTGETARHLIDVVEMDKPSWSTAELIQGLSPLLPRFYSIASSPKLFAHEIHLTVAYVQYEMRNRKRVGVGSHFLCDLAAVGASDVPIYVQPSHHFTLPSDPNAPILLIGPGTGVAPFRAFLQERIALNAPGKNWLFFGERHRATDFYYEPFWKELEKMGRLRLDAAFSRDGAQKVYVQHKMGEQKKDVWDWLQNGAYLYVCGDANEMAKDVDFTLRQVAKEVGGLSEEGARDYFKQLRAEKRYLLDVY